MLTAYFCTPNGGDGLPMYGTGQSVGLDICASENVTIVPGEIAIIPTGLVVKPPQGCYTLLFARSSLARKKGLMLANGVGVIDPDYCGPNDKIGISVFNFTSRDVNVNAGEGIAQLVFIPTVRADEIRHFYPTETDRGGFGSTGGYK